MAEETWRRGGEEGKSEEGFRKGWKVDLPI